MKANKDCRSPYEEYQYTIDKYDGYTNEILQGFLRCSDLPRLDQGAIMNILENRGQEPEYLWIYKLVKIVCPESGQPQDQGNWPVAMTLAGAKIAFREFCKDKIDEMASEGVIDDHDVRIDHGTFQLNREGRPICNWVITHECVPYHSIKEWFDYRQATRLEKPDDELYLERWLQKNGADFSGACSLVFDTLGAVLGLGEEEPKPLHYQLDTYNRMYPERASYEDLRFHSQKDAEDYWQSFCEEKMVEAARSSSAYAIQKLYHELEVRRNGLDALVYKLEQL